jgi:hypothetical protein
MLIDSLPFVLALYPAPSGAQIRRRTRINSLQKGSMAENAATLRLELPQAPVDLEPKILGIIGSFQLHTNQILLHNADDATVEVNIVVLPHPL